MQLGLVTAKVVPSTELEIRVESHKNLKKTCIYALKTRINPENAIQLSKFLKEWRNPVNRKASSAKRFFTKI